MDCCLFCFWRCDIRHAKYYYECPNIQLHMHMDQFDILLWHLFLLIMAIQALSSAECCSPQHLKHFVVIALW